MFCDPSVMILAFILESIPRCHLVSRYSIPGFSNQGSPYLLHDDSVASSFRLLVTFALVLEVRGISFFQIPWTTYGSSSSSNRKITTRVLLMSSPLYIVALPVLPFCMGYLEEICRTSFAMLNHASTTQKIVCSFELSLFSCLLTLVYQLRVCVQSFIDTYYFCGPSSHPIPEWLGETNSSTSSISRIGSKQLYSADQNANPAFALFYLGVLPSFISGLL